MPFRVTHLLSFFGLSDSVLIVLKKLSIILLFVTIFLLSERKSFFFLKKIDDNTGNPLVAQLFLSLVSL